MIQLIKVLYVYFNNYYLVLKKNIVRTFGMTVTIFISVCILFTASGYQDLITKNEIHNLTHALHELDKAIVQILLEPRANDRYVLIEYVQLFHQMFDIVVSLFQNNILHIDESVKSLQKIGGPRLLSIRLNVPMFKRRFQWNQSTVHCLYSMICDVDAKWKIMNMDGHNTLTADERREFMEHLKDASASG